MKVAILGYSTLPQSESVSAYNYFKAQDAEITIFYWAGNTTKADLPPDAHARICDEDAVFDELDEFDLIVRSPVIHPNRIKTTKPVTSVINEFFRASPTPIIGVTGTKGKGTTCTLIQKVLEAAGKKSVLAGNIGIPALDVLKEANEKDYVVLELSSFQLIDVSASPAVAVCLMVVPEHMDWHKSEDEYYESKANIFRYQKPHQQAVYNARNEISTKLAGDSPAVNKIAYDVPPPKQSPDNTTGTYVKGGDIFFGSTRVCSVNEVALLGRHNLENVCAAIAAVWELIGGNTDAIRSVVSSFKGLEHRLEFVAEVNQARYYNDSFATTPETAIAAIRSFTQPKVIILGGHDKGIPFDSLADEVAHANIRYVIAIGDTGEKILSLIHRHNPEVAGEYLESKPTMQQIVNVAAHRARPNDVVLLSTGCASFGLFKNYKDRGDQFRSAVKVLASAGR